MDMKKILSGVPVSEYPRIWNELSFWEWPPELGEAPSGWEEMNLNEKHEIIKPICEYLDVVVGRKGLLRYLHTTKFGKTDQEFDDWWDSNFSACQTDCKFKDSNEVLGKQAKGKTKKSTDYRIQHLETTVRTLICFLCGSVLGKLISAVFF